MNEILHLPLPTVAADAPAAVRLRLSIELDYDVADPGADFVFNIHAAQTVRQRVLDERLDVSRQVPLRVDTDATTLNRYLRLSAPAGPLRVAYTATVELRHHFARPEEIDEVPVAQLPTSLLPYVLPSRYCPSDRLLRLADRNFGALPKGYRRVEAVCNWVRDHVTFAAASSDGSTSALDTLLSAAGVCRDFSHLTIALCRALNIPARFTTGIDYGADPTLGPTDFHAYVEAYLGGRWTIFDPSDTAIPMGFVRFGTGRDAADAAFATIFGGVRAAPPRLAIEALPDAAGRLVALRRSGEAISTDGA